MNIPKVTNKAHTLGSIKVKTVEHINSESESNSSKTEVDVTSGNKTHKRPSETYYLPAQLRVECIYPIKTKGDLELMEDVLSRDKHYWDLLVKYL